MKKEKYNEAIKILTELLECKETDINLDYLKYTYYLLQFCYKNVKNDKDSLITYFKQYNLNKNDISLCIKIANILYETDIMFVKEFLTNNLNNFVDCTNNELMASYYNLLDLSYYYTGNKKEALEYAKKAFELSPTNKLYLDNLIIVINNVLNAE